MPTHSLAILSNIMSDISIPSPKNIFFDKHTRNLLEILYLKNDTPGYP